MLGSSLNKSKSNTQSACQFRIYFYYCKIPPNSLLNSGVSITWRIFLHCLIVEHGKLESHLHVLKLSIFANMQNDHFLPGAESLNLGNIFSKCYSFIQRKIKILTKATEALKQWIFITSGKLLLLVTQSTFEIIQLEKLDFVFTMILEC